MEVVGRYYYLQAVAEVHYFVKVLTQVELEAEEG